MKTLKALLCITLLFLAFSGGLQAASRKEIRLNTPFQSTLWRIDSDKSGDHIVTSFNDKTVTIWSGKNLSSHRLLRYPTRENEKQKRAHGVAISPDGQLIAYGVQPELNTAGKVALASAKIFVVDREAGRAVKNLDGGTLVTFEGTQVLRFSPDGEFLAAGFSDGCGLRVWDTSNWRLKLVDKFDDCASEIDITDLVFNPNSESTTWLVAVSKNGLRYYRKPSGERVDESPKVHWPEGLPSSSYPYGVSIDPSGKFLAVGGVNGFNVTVLTLEDPRLIRSINAEQIFSNKQQWLRDDSPTLRSHRVAFSTYENELFLFVAGAIGCKYVSERETENQNCGLRWSLKDSKMAGKFEVFEAGNDTVQDLRPVQQGIIVATQRNLSVIDYKTLNIAKGLGGKTITASNPAVDLRSIEEKVSDFDKTLFAVAENGKEVFFDDYHRTGENGKKLRFHFSVEKNELQIGPMEMPTDLKKRVQPPSDKGPSGNHAQNWLNKEATTTSVNGKNVSTTWRKRPISFEETSRSLVLSDNVAESDNGFFVWGSSEFLRVTDLAGQVICDLRIKSEAYRLTLSNNNRIAIVGHANGLINWYRIDQVNQSEIRSCSLTKILSLYIAQDPRGDWQHIAWTPKGQFMSSVGEEQLAGWVFAEPGSLPANIVFNALDQYTTEYFRPKIISALLDAETNFTLTRAIASKAAVDGPALVNVPPKITSKPSIRIVYPYKNRHPIDGPDRHAKFSFLVKAANADGNVTLEYSNSTEVSLQPEMLRITGGGEVFDRTFQLKDVAGEQTISLRVVNSDGERSRWVKASFIYKNATTRVKKYPFSNINVLTIGIGKYESLTPLNYANSDANQFRELISILSNTYYNNVSNENIYSGIGLQKTFEGGDVDDYDNSVYGIMGKFAGRTDSNSLTLITVSAHGEVDVDSALGGKTFIPLIHHHSINPKNNLRRIHRFALDQLINQAALIKGTVVIFLDVCRADGIVKDTTTFIRFLRDAMEKKSRDGTASFVFLSTGGSPSSKQTSNLSFECSGLNNGCFTQALLEAITGNGVLNGAPVAVGNGDGMISADELKDYLSKRVSFLAARNDSGRLQFPYMLSTLGADDRIIFPEPPQNFIKID